MATAETADVGPATMGIRAKEVLRPELRLVDSLARIGADRNVRELLGYGLLGTQAARRSYR